MQLAHEALALLVHDRAHVLEQHLTGAVDLGQALDRFRQVVLSSSELRYKAGGQSRLLQHPRVFSRETGWPPRVVSGDEAQSLVSRAPGHADRIRYAEGLEHIAELRRFAGVGSEDEVLINHATRKVVAVRLASRGLEPGEECAIDAEAALNRGQLAVIAEPPEDDFVGAHELTEGLRQLAVEVAEILTRDRLRRDGK